MQQWKLVSSQKHFQTIHNDTIDSSTCWGGASMDSTCSAAFACCSLSSLSSNTWLRKYSTQVSKVGLSVKSQDKFFSLDVWSSRRSLQSQQKKSRHASWYVQIGVKGRDVNWWEFLTDAREREDCRQWFKLQMLYCHTRISLSKPQGGEGEASPLYW
jgi:hypothetical protein